MEMQKAMMPHLAFFFQPVENRNKSLELGSPQFDNVPHVRITAPGSRDSISKPVLPWLDNCDQQVREERLPAEWATKYRRAYEHWLAGEEMPVEGIPLSMWDGISPAERETCKGLHILTVETLATCNEEAKRRLGMGGLALSQRAKKYLDAVAGPGAVMAENADLRQKYETSETRRIELEGRIAALEAKFGAEVAAVHIPTDNGIERKL